MTFREKWEQEHPSERFSVLVAECPCMHEYEPRSDDDECEQPPLDCDTCWDREVPEERGCIIGDEKVEHPDTDLPAEPTIKDSGSTTEFETGAHRDARGGKGRCDLLPLEIVRDLMTNPRSKEIIDSINEFQKTGDTACLTHCLIEFASTYQTNSLLSSICTMCLEVAKHYEEGANKYGANNWKRGMPTHIYIDSALRHYLKFLRGDKDENHDLAFIWNIMCCIWEVDHHKEETE